MARYRVIRNGLVRQQIISLKFKVYARALKKRITADIFEFPVTVPSMSTPVISEVLYGLFAHACMRVGWGYISPNICV